MRCGKELRRTAALQALLSSAAPLCSAAATLGVPNAVAAWLAAQWNMRPHAPTGASHDHAAGRRSLQHAYGAAYTV
jgi:hypothetical protein